MKKRALLSFTGDIMCQKDQLSACRISGGFDFDAVFEPAEEALAASDFLIGNLETPLAGKEAGYTGELYSFNTPDEFARTLGKFGFDLVSTANNHCLDRGVEGLKRTLNALDRADVAHTGTARSWAERDRPFLRDINGIRTAFCSFTYGTNAFANGNFLTQEEQFAVNLLQPQETLPGAIHLLEPPESIAGQMRRNRTGAAASPQLDRLRSDIQSCRSAGADFVIVLMHCGGQYNPLPDPYTEFIVGRLRAFGADMIVGNHPHVVQRAELGSAPIFYSLGNFCCTPGESPGSRENPVSATSLLLTVGLEKDENGTRPVSVQVRAVRSILRENGTAVTMPVADLLKSETDPAKRKQYADGLRLVLNAFLGRPPGTAVEIRDAYFVPVS